MNPSTAFYLGFLPLLLAAVGALLSLVRLWRRRRAQRLLIEFLSVFPLPADFVKDLDESLQSGLLGSPSMLKAESFVRDSLNRLDPIDRSLASEGLRQDSPLGRARYIQSLIQSASGVSRLTPTSHESSKVQHPFCPDRPIETSNDDRLGRTPFAREMAESIRGWRGSDSLVIALYGPWGSGKSSLKNLVIESLHSRAPLDPSSVTVLDFNPWAYSQHHLLSEAFFRELSIALAHVPRITTAGRSKLLRRWMEYGSLVVAGLANYRHASRPFLLFPFSVSFKSRGMLTLEEQKRSLALTLRRLSGTFLVVMDDIDRLEPDEIKELFRIVKANADFPNLVYLLLLERTFVERTLGVPPDYLDKIIQVAFTVPEPDQNDVNAVLFEYLDRLLTSLQVPRTFDRRRWANLYLGTLQSYFDSLRDVYRFVSTLAFHVSLLRGEDVLEVNFIDLISIEVLRIFEPAVYAALPKHKRLLVASGHLLNERVEASKQELAELLALASPPYRLATSNLIRELFPGAKRILTGVEYGTDYSQELDRDLSVGSPRHFDHYFSLQLPKGQISESQLQRVLATISDRIAFTEHLLALAESKQLASFVERLELYKTALPLEPAISFLTSLFDTADLLPVGRSTFFEIEPLMHASRVVYWYLIGEKDLGRRTAVLFESLELTKGIALPVRVTSLLTDHRSEADRQVEWTIDEHDASRLRTLCVQKIQEAATDSRLSRNPHLASILYRWREWAGPEPAKEFVRELIATPSGAMRFLTAMMSISAVSHLDDVIPTERFWMRLKNLEDFADWKVLESRVSEIRPEDLSEAERNALQSFRLAVRRRRLGLPDLDSAPRMSDSAEEDMGGN